MTKAGGGADHCALLAAGALARPKWCTTDVPVSVARPSPPIGASVLPDLELPLGLVEAAGVVVSSDLCRGRQGHLAPPYESE
jgi:hypothetical protein